MNTAATARDASRRARRSALIADLQRKRAKVIAQAQAIRELGGDPHLLLESIDAMNDAELALSRFDMEAAA